MEVSLSKIRTGRRRWQILITRGRNVRVITCSTKAEAELTMKALTGFFGAIAIGTGAQSEKPLRGAYIAEDYYGRGVYENDLIRGRIKPKAARPATRSDYEKILEGEMIYAGD